MSETAEVIPPPDSRPPGIAIPPPPPKATPPYPPNPGATHPRHCRPSQNCPGPQELGPPVGVPHEPSGRRFCPGGQAIPVGRVPCVAVVDVVSGVVVGPGIKRSIEGVIVGVVAT